MNNLKKNFDTAIEKVLIVLENTISVVSIMVLVFILMLEILIIIAEPMEYLTAPGAVSNYLHEMLTIVIGLEFVKLLMHLTPANILEVLTMAISRSIIVSHGSAMDSLLGIICIVLLFATRRFLIPKKELHQEMADDTVICEECSTPDPQADSPKETEEC